MQKYSGRLIVGIQIWSWILQVCWLSAPIHCASKEKRMFQFHPEIISRTCHVFNIQPTFPGSHSLRLSIAHQQNLCGHKIRWFLLVFKPQLKIIRCTLKEAPIQRIDALEIWHNFLFNYGDQDIVKYIFVFLEQWVRKSIDKSCKLSV